MTAGKRQPRSRWSWVWIPFLLWKGVNLAFQAIGLAGLPDDLATWEKWLDFIMHDPAIALWAERAVTVAQFTNQWWVRALLFAIGTIGMLWGVRPVWRLRHKLSFRWRRLLAEQVWITAEDALKIIRESNWARLKEPTTPSFGSVWNNLFGERQTISGLSNNQRQGLKFDAFLSLVLKKFCEANPNSHRVNEGSKEIDEVALRAALDKALESELVQDFGDIPTLRVD